MPPAQVRKLRTNFGGKMEKGYLVFRIKADLEEPEEEKDDDAGGYTTEYEEDRSESGSALD
jgi:hypothetical protein